MWRTFQCCVNVYSGQLIMAGIDGSTAATCKLRSGLIALQPQQPTDSRTRHAAGHADQLLAVDIDKCDTWRWCPISWFTMDTTQCATYRLHQAHLFPMSVTYFYTPTPQATPSIVLQHPTGYAQHSLAAKTLFFHLIQPTVCPDVCPVPTLTRPLGEQASHASMLSVQTSPFPW